MEIDLFTFIAQIVNFIILVLLLNRFLFGPVSKAMAAREKKIADEAAEAQRKNAEAGGLADKSLELLKKQEQDADRAMAEARAAADAAKQEMLGMAKKETDDARRLWHEALAAEKRNFLDGLRRRSGGFAAALAERAVRDLADEELSARITDVFIARIRGLDEKKASEFSGAIQKAKGKPAISGTFEVPADEREKIISAIKDRLGYGGGITFETDPVQVCGLELKIDGFRISWTIRDYLEGMEEELGKVWEGG